jgi:Protein of unknown function (DUF3426)
MVVQCPRCRTLNEFDRSSLISDTNHTQCRSCSTIIDIPYVMSTISPMIIPHTTAIPPSDNLPPQTSRQYTYSEIPELRENSQLHAYTSSSFGWWITAILGLLIIFILQSTYFMRDDLARHDILRPVLEKFCGLAACKIPLRKDISKIIIVNREIHNATNTKNILQVNITLKNIASYIQPFPKMQLSFSDINGNRIAYRRFTPEEYLLKKTDVSEGMAPQIPVIANLKILDPGEHAIAFQFEFF